MKLPKALERVIESFEKLPGIGPKTAQRLAFYLLHVPQSDLDNFGENLKNLKSQTILCSTCFNIGESDPCFICSDPARDNSHNGRRGNIPIYSSGIRQNKKWLELFKNHKNRPRFANWFRH